MILMTLTLCLTNASSPLLPLSCAAVPLTSQSHLILTMRPSIALPVISQSGSLPCNESTTISRNVRLSNAPPYPKAVKLLVFIGHMITSINRMNQLYVERRRHNWLHRASASSLKILTKLTRLLSNWSVFVSS